MQSRTLDQIRQDYAKLCQMLGEKNYLREMLGEEVVRLSAQIKELNQEAAAISPLPPIKESEPLNGNGKEESNGIGKEESCVSQ